MPTEETSAPIRCANCGILIRWPAIRRGEQAYCCQGCAVGGPCTCSYDRPPAGAPFKAVLAIVAENEAADLLACLAALGHRATTLRTDDGRSRCGSSVLMTGVDAALLDRALETIGRRCRMRTAAASGAPEAADAANVFVWEVERWERL